MVVALRIIQGTVRTRKMAVAMPSRFRRRRTSPGASTTAAPKHRIPSAIAVGRVSAAIA